MGSTQGNRIDLLTGFGFSEIWSDLTRLFNQNLIVIDLNSVKNAQA
ncbi:MAG: hypothetical protein F6K36_17385 [Symploca sp. SIO3C6]|nr:hypothetical protein [Symploca sp. SIO3C6]